METPADVVEELGRQGLRVVRDVVHEGQSGGLRVLWLVAEPRRSPEEEYDLVVSHGGPDGWGLTTPAGAHQRVAEAGEVGATAARMLTEGDELSSGDATVRGLPEWAMFLAGGTLSTVVVPFVQALVSRSADDVYDKIKSKLGRSPGAEKAEQLSVVDPETGVRVLLPAELPEEALYQLSSVLRAEPQQRLLAWDADQQRWIRMGAGS